MSNVKNACLLGPLLASLVFAAPAASARVQLEGVQFEPVREVAGQSLDLNGAAIFHWVMFKVYAAGLYLPAGADASDALDPAVPRRLEIAYFRDVEGDDLGRAARVVLERTLSPDTLAALDERIERLHGWYRGVGPGDRYALTWAPGVGTTLELNGEALGTVEGEDFGAAYFAIWLGEQPIDEDLRAALLAGDAVPAAAPVRRE